MRFGYRARLAGWHAIVLGLILGVSVVVLDWTVRRIILDQVDATLLHAAQTIGAEIGEEGPTSPVDVLSTIKPVRRLLWRFQPIIQVVDRGGRVVAVLGERAPLPIDAAQINKVIGRGKIVFQTIATAESRALRVAALRAAHGQAIYAVQVAHPLDDVYKVLARIRWLLVAAALAILLAILATDFVLTRQVLRPIDAIVQRARRLTAASLTEPLPHPGEPGEVARLVETLNAMLGRIRESVEIQRRFTTDAAHELRSPLTRLRTEIEVTMRRPRVVEEYRATLAAALEEIERLGALVESLLTLARLDAGEGQHAVTGRTRLAPMLEAVVGRVTPIAARRSILLRIAPDVTDAVVDVAPGILDVAIGNIVDNAVKFSSAGGTVELNIAITAAEVFVTVADTGPGIPADELPHVFERFFRGKSARAMGTSGVGLGLAIAQTLVQRQGGTVDIDSKPGVGTAVTIRLPLTVGGDS
jgi:two-component system OmpR family sensor kinase